MGFGGGGGRCIICGVDNATCGEPTAHRIVPVDTITGYTVVDGRLVSDPATRLQAVLGDMTTEEREEYMMMSALSEGRKLRNTVMTAGPLGHTYLVYVQCVDGFMRKMTQADADAYVEHYGDVEGVEIVKRGEQPVPDPEAPPVGATKATIGTMFSEDGIEQQQAMPESQLPGLIAYPDEVTTTGEPAAPVTSPTAAPVSESTTTTTESVAPAPESSAAAPGGAHTHPASAPSSRPRASVPSPKPETEE